MKLSVGKREQIEARMKKYARLRREKQPLNLPNAGSVFKRPTGIYVGPLIEKMGLKGFRIGDAQVSTKHAGFIVNCGQASAQDVIDLIKHIQHRALNEHNISLEPEVRIIGEE